MNKVTLKGACFNLQGIQTQVIPDELIIENSRHVYTTEYTALVKDFYLNM